MIEPPRMQHSYPALPDPADAQIGLALWLAKYSQAQYRAVHKVVLRLNHVPEPALATAIEDIRTRARSMLAQSCWGASMISVHEKWWPVGFYFQRLATENGMPYFTARSAFGHRGAYFVELSLEATTIPMMPQMGHAGMPRGE